MGAGRLSAIALRRRATRAAGAAFVPTDISGLQAWYDASDAASITDSGGAVSQWNDKSGNTRHLVQATGGAKPTTGSATLNGKNVLALDGGDHLLYLGNTAIGPNASVFIVCEQLVSVVNAGIFVPFASSSSDDYNTPNAFCLTTGDASNFFNAVRTLSVIADYPGVGVMPAAVWTARLTSAGATALYRNGGTPNSASAANTYGTADSGLLIGARYIGGTYGTANLNGNIGEIVAYDSALSTTNMNLVGNYLAAKWGFTWTNV